MPKQRIIALVNTRSAKTGLWHMHPLFYDIPVFQFYDMPLPRTPFELALDQAREALTLRGADAVTITIIHEPWRLRKDYMHMILNDDRLGHGDVLDRYLICRQWIFERK